MTAPLQGLTVIELANYVAAPSAGALMRDLGADVIKLEPPGGEVMRGVNVGKYPNFLFDLENRGKRSVTVALDKPGATEMVHRLLEGADVLLSNLTAPRLRKFGLMPDDVLARNPHIVHVSVTGYGLSGPESDRPAFDFAAFWARSGIMSLVGHPGSAPVLARMAMGDHTTAINVLAATLAALRMRDLTGKGSSVDVTLQQTGMFTLGTDIARVLIDKTQPSRFDRTAVPNPLFNTYPTSDGKWVLIVHVTPDPFWPKLCAALDRQEWLDDAGLSTMRGRLARAAELCTMIETRFKEETFAYWAERLEAQGMIWAPMSELPDVISNPQLRHQNAFGTIPRPDGPIESVGVPFSIAGADIGIRGASPEAGADTFDVLAAAGYDTDAIAKLAEDGVLG